MYVAVKGGERAIEQSWDLLAKARRGDTSIPALTVTQIREQMRLAVARVMSEGALYDETLAALAIKQAAGDLVEAIFLLRAYRTTLPRLGTTTPIDTAAMRLSRRISATFKDVPGGQLLGATYDYTQRLLDFALLAEDDATTAPLAGEVREPRADAVAAQAHAAGNTAKSASSHADSANDGDAATGSNIPPLPPIDTTPRVTDILGRDGLLESLRATDLDPEPHDLVHTPLFTPASRTARLQNQDVPPQFTQGYGLAFGHNERKALAMSLVDRALRTQELGDAITSPAQQQEFVLYHSDNVEASGFVQHLKLPHYVDFQAELELVRRLRAEHAAKYGAQAAPTAGTDEAEGDLAPAAQDKQEAA
jgi:alpha-D-ribose 1-methylphosphonate 5-triphosphate synthase subunit PhnI